MLINELIGNYFAKVNRANKGMPIWDSSICYNDTRPRFISFGTFPSFEVVIT